MSETTTREDIYTRVTAKVVADLERGVRPWLTPWNAEHAAGRVCRPLRSCGEPYRGINVLVLWCEAEARGYAAPLWLTFRQAKELGGFVKKGEKGTPVVYASSFTKTDTDGAGREVERDVHFLKQYNVFNAEQVEGLPARFYAPAERLAETVERLAHADWFFQNTGATIRHGGNRAYYALEADYVQLPPFEAFRDAESYAATAAHELAHWTRHPSRLARDFGRKQWGDAGYAMEELVAELGAAFLSADLALTPEPREDHAAYLASWLAVLKEDNRAVFRAAAHAERAVGYLHGLQPK